MESLSQTAVVIASDNRPRKYPNSYENGDEGVSDAN